MTTQNRDTRKRVRDYIGRGVFSVPVPPGEKGPKDKGWNNNHIGLDRVDAEFKAGSNILRRNGKPSGWQVDVDCDCREAVIAAPHYLPTTAWVHGHAGNPASHHTFICEGVKSEDFNDPTVNPAEQKARKGKRRAMIDSEEDEFTADQWAEVRKQDKATLLELRSTGLGTIMPGSVHPSGNEVVFYRDGQPIGADLPEKDPTRVDPEVWRQAVHHMAAATLLAKQWADGIHNELCLRVSGMLMHGGMAVADAEKFLTAVCDAAGDEQVEKRLNTLRATAEKYTAGEKVMGFPSVAELLDERAVKKISEWLRLNKVKTSKDGKPLLVVGGDFDQEITECVAFLLAGNEPEANLFCFGDKLAVIESEPSPRVRVLTVNNLRERVARHMQVVTASVKKNPQGEEEVTYKNVTPPLPLLQSLAETALLSEFPQLTRLSSVPVVGPSGELQPRYGYHASTKTFVYSRGIETPLGDGTVDKAAVQRSIAWYKEWPLSGFMFDTPASLTHTICGILTPYVRDLIAGETPLFLVQAPTRGSGKSKLARLCIGINAQTFHDTILARSEQEVQKQILSLLRTGPSHILFDNVRGTVNSGSLDKVLTSDIYTDRILGRSETETYPNKAMWWITSNNAFLGGDLPSRTVLIGLDTGMERPEQRTDFKTGDLNKWLAVNRLLCVQHALTLIRYWLQEGMPLYAGPNYHRAKDWAQVLGGICEAVGLPGFLDNTEEIEQNADDEHERACQFVEGWFSHFGTRAVGAGSLVQDAYGVDDEDVPAPLWSEKVDRLSNSGKVQSLGHWLKTNRNRPFNGLRLTVESGNHANLYRLSETASRAGVVAAQEKRDKALKRMKAQEETAAAAKRPLLRIA